MKHLSRPNGQDDLSHFARLRTESDCSWMTDCRGAIVDRWNEGVSGKVSVVCVSVLLLLGAILVLYALGQFWPTFDPSM